MINLIWFNFTSQFLQDLKETFYASDWLTVCRERWIYYIGSDEYKFKANNGYKDSIEAVVTVNVVIDPNLKAPNVSDITVTTTVNTLVAIPTNVTDDQNYPITYTIVDVPDNGLAVINNNGEIEYTPNTDYVGEDIVTFTANNGFLDSVVATVIITVE